MSEGIRDRRCLMREFAAAGGVNDNSCSASIKKLPAP
jgi:hypothetical protein